MTLPKEELKVGGIYKLNSRNLLAGVWNGDLFIGIREKFGYRYLDEESLWETNSRGTARPLEYIGDVPDHIKLASGWPDDTHWHSNHDLYDELKQYEHA